MSITALLDRARSLGILGNVSDEGNYWEHRDERRLASEVGQWNEMIAGIVGRFKDALGDEAAAEITKFPNFEHLEACGRADE